jgi:hypothetical protein
MTVSVTLPPEIYVQFSNDGAHIRKWSRQPIAGALLYRHSANSVADAIDATRRAAIKAQEPQP